MSTETSEVNGRSAYSARAHRKVTLLTRGDLDGRSRAKVVTDEICELLISERGGRDRLDTMRIKHCDTWAVLTAMIEDLATRYLMGQEIEPSAIATLCNARRREGELLGNPSPRDVTPSLGEYLRVKAPGEPADTFSTSLGNAGPLA